ncbi:hypothetical protein ACPUER_19970 [Burkholderia sp. DN3021]|uniref:hypothetical protein n=1 Tax=Burkholderia sp. DN3021 TaxID=3410137 RepID=UPI003C7B4E8E
MPHTIAYAELTAHAERQIREYVALAAAAGDDPERGAMRASAVSVFAFWVGHVNRLRKTADEAGRRMLNADESRLLALVA